MKDEELTGQIIMVHPDLHDDPAQRMGEIGTVAVASLAEDLVRVKFDDNQRSLYGTDAIMVFKTTDEIYGHLKQDVMQLSPKDFKDLKNIALLLDYGTTNKQRTAMEIVQRNREILEATMLSLEDKLSLDQAQKRGR